MILSGGLTQSAGCSDPLVLTRWFWPVGFAVSCRLQSAPLSSSGLWASALHLGSCWLGPQAVGRPCWPRLVVRILPCLTCVKVFGEVISSSCSLSLSLCRLWPTSQASTSSQWKVQSCWTWSVWDTEEHDAALLLWQPAVVDRKKNGRVCFCQKRRLISEIF